MELSKHAQVRMSQRGITKVMINILIKFGITQYHNGCKILSLNKKSIKQLQAIKTPKKLIDKVKKLYVVLNSENKLILTAAVRQQRLKKDRKNFQKQMRLKRKWRRSKMLENML